ncbi:MAG: shikimate kinase [Thermoplasmataceae archaeon]
MEVRCHGGISVISAFSQEVGSSAAIGLDLSVRFSLSLSPDGISREARKTLDFISAKYPGSQTPSLTIESNIPQSQGLKSSSAFTLAIVAGFLSINNIKISETELLQLSAQASLVNGTSLTGAYDDLCSSYYGGACLTNNRTMKILKRIRAPAGYLAIAYNPEKYRETRSIDTGEMKRAEESWKPLKKLVSGGYILEAATLNGMFVGEYTGLNGDIISYFRNMGARFVSQSGKGPAIFAVFQDRKRKDDAISQFPPSTGFKCVETTFTDEGMRVEKL